MQVDTTDLNANPDKQPRPYVRFELRSRETRAPDGTPQFEDVAWALVTPSGSRDVLEKIATEWIAGLEAHAVAGRIPAQWPAEYRAALKGWLEGQEVPVGGTPVKNWPALSASQRKAVENAGILSVEDLALANDEAKGRIGMGCETIVNMAKAWVADKNGPGALAAKYEDAMLKNAALQERVASMEKTVAELLARIPKDQVPETPERPTGVMPTIGA